MASLSISLFCLFIGTILAAAKMPAARPALVPVRRRN
jgi:hypothetical protein